VLWLGVAAAAAATIAVTTTADTLAGAQCSLRAAIQSANTDAAVGGCVAGAGSDVISVPAGDYKLAIAPSGNDDNTTGDLDIASNLAIAGAGASTTTIDGAGIDRVLTIATGASVTISNVTVTGGQAPAGFSNTERSGPPDPDSYGLSGLGGDGGGGIEVKGVLTLTDDIVTDNRAGVGGNGANAANAGTGVEFPPTSDIAPCQGGDSEGGYGGAGGSGGGIEVSNGYLTLDSTQVTDNHAGSGGDGGDAAGGGAGLAAASCTNASLGARGGDAVAGLAGVGGVGGGISLSGTTGSLTATDCVISGNVAGDGGLPGTEGTGGAGGAAPEAGTGGSAVGAPGGDGGSGGAIQSTVDVSLSRCTIGGNDAGSGGTGADGGTGGGGGFSSTTGAGSYGGDGGSASGGSGGSGGAGGAIALAQDAVATVSASTIAANRVGVGGAGGAAGGAPDVAGGGGVGGFGTQTGLARAGDASGGAGGAAGTGTAIDDGSASAATSTVADDTIDANLGSTGGAGGNGGATDVPNGSTVGGSGGAAPGLAVASTSAPGNPIALTHATVDANTVGAPGGGGLGGDGSNDGPGATGASAAAGGIAGPVTLAATIVSGNQSAQCAASSGVSNGGDDISYPDAGCPGATGNPLLAPLADNAGPTQTQALQVGSVARAAIAAGDALCAGTDGRGIARPPASACDIGAYQTALPGAATGDASVVTMTSAAIAAQVTANDPSVTVVFQYGTTPSYGSSTAIQTLPASTTPTGVTANLTGLAANTTYHYRVVATNRDGTTQGADATLTTVKIAAGGGSGPAGGAGTHHPFAGLLIGRQTVRLTAKRIAAIAASCPASTDGVCAGTIKLQTRVTTVVHITRHGKPKKLRRHTLVTLAHLKFKVAAGHAAKLKLRLSAAAATRVKRASKLGCTASAVAADSVGHQKTTTGRVTLKPYVRPPHSHHHG
jgi:CSLREA domain-containing protein